MPFTFDDALEVLGASQDQEQIELFRSDKVTIEIAASGDSKEITKVQTLFPDVKFSTTNQVIYFPMRMCHSLPTVNARGRCFHPNVLQRSFASAQDNLIDIDHELLDNGIGDYDNICGHIKAVRFDPTLQWKEVANKNTLPTDPIPMYALGCLFMRHSEIPKIVKRHMTGKEKWGVSMECGHKYSEADILYKGEFIPFKDAPGYLQECIKQDRVSEYKGEKVALALGGRDYQVNFWGAGITMNPADEDGKVLSMFAGSSMELASLTGKKFFPLRTRIFEKGLELANLSVDKAVREMASIAIIGETLPADDGHAHKILSDGTIIPANGHSHYLENYNITTGRKPSLTGRTSVHYDRIRLDSTYPESYTEVVHIHLVEIDLRAKSSGSTDVESDVVTETSSIEGGLQVKMTDLLKKLEDGINKLSTGNQDSKKPDDKQASELASLTNIIKEMAAEETMVKAIEDSIQEKITSGEVIKKDDLQAKIDEAVSKVKADYEAKQKQTELLSARRQEVTALGLNLEACLDEDDEETIGDIVSSFGFDEAGEKNWGRYSKTLKKVAEAAIAAAGKDAKAVEEEARAAASKTNGTAANKDSKKKPQLLLVSGGGREVAGKNTGGSGSGSNAETSVGKHRLFSK